MTASAPKPVRILVADDHAMVLEMFEHFLSNLPNVTAETAADLDEALEKIKAERLISYFLISTCPA